MTLVLAAASFQISGHYVCTSESVPHAQHVRSRASCIGGVCLGHKEYLAHVCRSLKLGPNLEHPPVVCGLHACVFGFGDFQVPQHPHSTFHKRYLPARLSTPHPLRPKHFATVCARCFLGPPGRCKQFGRELRAGLAMFEGSRDLVG